MRARLREILALRVLPPPVRRFRWSAQRHARRRGDVFSLRSAARPAELAELLALARGRTAVVELGTGTAWTAVSLALADPARRVISYDPCVRPEREAYLGLAGAPARERIDLRNVPDSTGPRADDPPVELLFIDSAHERAAVVSAFEAWRAALAPAAVVVFHDYRHPDYPGVSEAIAELALAGQESGGLFAWQAP